MTATYPGGIYTKKVIDGATGVIALHGILSQGLISGAANGGSLTLEGCHDPDGTLTFGTQVFTTLAPEAFAAIGPFAYLKYTQAGGEGYINVQ